MATLIQAYKNAGEYETVFDASALSSGIYIANMQAVGESGEQFSQKLKMQLIK